MTPAKKKPAPTSQPEPLEEEVLESLLRFLQESGPAGINRSVIDVIISKKALPPRPGEPARLHSLVPDEHKNLAWRYLEELMRRGEIDERNKGGQQPYYVAFDLTRFRQWAREDAGGDEVIARKVARRRARQAQRAGQGDASNPPTGESRRGTRKASGRGAGSASGDWTVVRKNRATGDEIVVGKFEDKQKARATARKSRLNGCTVLILDLHDQVTNQYDD